MSERKYRWLVVLGAMACARSAPSMASAVATPPAYDALAPFGTPLACREITMKSTDSAQFGFEFRDAQDAQTARRVMFAYDSLGSPLYGTVTATAEQGSGAGWIEMLAMRFAPVPSGRRGRIDYLAGETPANAIARSANAAQRELAMSVAALTRAEQLGRWAWEHRCRSGRSD